MEERIEEAYLRVIPEQDRSPQVQKAFGIGFRLAESKAERDQEDSQKDMAASIDRAISALSECC